MALCRDACSKKQCSCLHPTPPRPTPSPFPSPPHPAPNPAWGSVHQLHSRCSCVMPPGRAWQSRLPPVGEFWQMSQWSATCFLFCFTKQTLNMSSSAQRLRASLRPVHVGSLCLWGRCVPAGAGGRCQLVLWPQTRFRHEMSVLLYLGTRGTCCQRGGAPFPSAFRVPVRAAPALVGGEEALLPEAWGEVHAKWPFRLSSGDKDRCHQDRQVEDTACYSGLSTWPPEGPPSPFATLRLGQGVPAPWGMAAPGHRPQELLGTRRRGCRGLPGIPALTRSPPPPRSPT